MMAKKGLQRAKRDARRRVLGAPSDKRRSALVGVALSGVIAGYVFHDLKYAMLIDLTLLGVITTMFMYIEYYALIGFGDGKGSALTAFANSFFS